MHAARAGSRSSGRRRGRATISTPATASTAMTSPGADVADLRDRVPGHRPALSAHVGCRRRRARTSSSSCRCSRGEMPRRFAATAGLRSRRSAAAIAARSTARTARSVMSLRPSPSPSRSRSIAGISTRSGSSSPARDRAGVEAEHREIVRADRLAVAQDRRARQHVLELADVAGPAIASAAARAPSRSSASGTAPRCRRSSSRRRAASRGCARRAAGCLPCARAAAAPGSARPRGASRGPRGTGRARRAASDPCSSPRRTRTSICDRAIAADRLDLALLQHAQELVLHARVDVADLVEEDRAAVRLAEQAAARAVRRR